MSKIVLNGQQASALSLVQDWWNSPRKFTKPFLLTGCAGTGKTSLLLEILDKLNIPSGRVRLGAPTGKAARVMERKSKMTAQTLHQILMKPVEDQIKEMRKYLTDLLDAKEVFVREHLAKNDKYDGWDNGDYDKSIRETMQIIEELSVASREENGAKFGKQPFGALRASTDLLALDEGSMIGEPMRDIIKETKIPHLVMFDPFQLQPVNAKMPWIEKPDVFLTELMRSGPGSGVSICATSIREGRGPVENDDVRIINKSDHKVGDLAGYDMILCGTNRVRRNINAKMRQYYGREGIPKEGDRIMCLSNDHRVRNGELFTVKHAFQSRFDHNIVIMDIVDDDGILIDNIKAWLPVFDDESQTKKGPYNVSYFTYGYAITVHKSQGSEANNVLLIDDWPGSDHTRWFYTGVTRARKTCTIMRNV